MSDDQMTVDVNFEADTYELRRNIVNLAAQEIAKTAEKDVKVEVVQNALDQVMAQLQPDLDSLLDGPIQITNNYGEPTGNSRTFREEVVKRAQEYLDQTVSKLTGKAKSRVHSSSDKYCTRAEYLVRSAAREAVEEELQARIREVVKQAKKEIAADADAMIREAVREIVGLED